MDDLDKKLLLHVLSWLVLSVGLLGAFVVCVVVHPPPPVRVFVPNLAAAPR